MYCIIQISYLIRQKLKHETKHARKYVSRPGMTAGTDLDTLVRKYVDTRTRNHLSMPNTQKH